MIGATLLFVRIGGAELDKTFNVGIDPAASDLVTARFREIGLAEAGEHRTREHDRTPERRAFADKFSTPHIVAVDAVRLEAVLAFLVAGNLDAHLFKKADQILDIQNLWNIGHPYRFIGQQDGAQDLQRLVLGALRGDAAGKAVAAFNGKGTHMISTSGRRRTPKRVLTESMILSFRATISSGVARPVALISTSGCFS